MREFAGQRQKSFGVFVIHRLYVELMGLSLDGDALCNRCALLQDTLEIRFDPQDGQIYEDLSMCVRVDQTIDRPER